MYLIFECAVKLKKSAVKTAQKQKMQILGEAAPGRICK